MLCGFLSGNVHSSHFLCIFCRNLWTENRRFHAGLTIQYNAKLVLVEKWLEVLVKWRNCLRIQKLKGFQKALRGLDVVGLLASSLVISVCTLSLYMFIHLFLSFSFFLILVYYTMSLSFFCFFLSPKNWSALYVYVYSTFVDSWT